MYSVVLMMAVTSGAEAPDFGRRGCNGCNGGCHGGYVSSCHGGGHGCHGGGHGCHGGHGCRGGGLLGGLFGGHHNRCNGCSGYCHGGYVGCHGGYGGYVGCHGGHGGYVGCHGGHGGYVGCHGGHGGFGGCHGGYVDGHGCHGGVIVPGTGPGGVIVEPKTKEMPKGKEGKDKSSLERPATIVVTLPEDARLSIDGNNTTSTSTRRTFITPALDVNSEYVYTLRAEVMVEGRAVVETQTVTVRGGQMTTVPFNFSSTVASR